MLVVALDFEKESVLLWNHVLEVPLHLPSVDLLEIS